MPVTKAEAIAYVKTIERKWGIEPVIISIEPATEDDAAWDVRTAYAGVGNYWTVWRESDGAIYGEC